MTDEEFESSKAQLVALEAQLEKAGGETWDKSSTLVVGGSLLVFFIVLTAIMAALILKGKSPQVLMRTFTVPLICVLAVFLVVTGFSQEQMASVFGLLGTVAGYLLGKADSRS